MSMLVFKNKLFSPELSDSSNEGTILTETSCFSDLLNSPLLKIDSDISLERISLEELLSILLIGSAH